MHSLKTRIPVLLLAAILLGSIGVSAQEKKSPRGFVLDNPAAYQTYPDFLGGPGAIKYKEAFTASDFKTRHQFLRVGVVPPKSGIGEYRLTDADEVFIVTAGEVIVSVKGHAGRILGGSLVPFRAGDTVAVYNATDRDASFFWVATSQVKDRYTPSKTGADITKRNPEVPVPFAWTPLFFGNYTTPIDQAHGGKGRILNGYGGLSFDFFPTRWGVGALILPPDTSIGYHRHTLCEEMYVMVAGQARGTVNDVTLDLKPGDAMLQQSGSSHGLYNNGKEDLYIICTGLSTEPDGRMDNTNLDDDLSKR